MSRHRDDVDRVVADLYEVFGPMKAHVDATKGALNRRIGHRGAALLFFGFLDAVYCFSLLRPSREVVHAASMVYLATIAPLWGYGVLWGIAGVLCLVTAFFRDDKAGFTAAIAVKVLWGTLWVGAIFAGVNRAYVSVTIWYALAGFIAIIAGWPEPVERRGGD